MIHATTHPCNYLLSNGLYVMEQLTYESLSDVHFRSCSVRHVLLRQRQGSRPGGLSAGGAGRLGNPTLVH
jgi:hypothetical protein